MLGVRCLLGSVSAESPTCVGQTTVTQHMEGEKRKPSQWGGLEIPAATKGVKEGPLHKILP